MTNEAQVDIWTDGEDAPLAENCSRQGLENIAKAALRAVEPADRLADRNAVLEEAAAWHEDKAAVARSKHNPRMNITALLVAQVHEESAAAIRALRTPEAPAQAGE